MVGRSSVIGVALAMVIACPIGLTRATGPIGVKAAPAQDWTPWPGVGRSLGFEAGSFANVVEGAKAAVISVRARHAVDVGELNVGGPPDHLVDPSIGPRGRPPGRPRVSASEGSGFFISADGYAVTNHHVTAGSERVKIIADDQKTYDAKVVASDPPTDIALLKVEGHDDFAFVKFADTAPRVGDRIFAVGNPFGLGGTVTAGIVSARDRTITSDERPSGANMYEDLIQVDAAINRGNSGGPSFDTEGKVIGVNTVILSPTGGSVGIGFAIPAATAKTVIAQLIGTGSVMRGWLGVKFQTLTPAIAEVLGLDEVRGALVVEPLSNGPAGKAGIAAGDLIGSINGETVKDDHDLSRKMIGLAPGISVNLGVRHDGTEKAVAVTLGEVPAARAQFAPSLAHATEPAVAPPSWDLGLKLAPAVETSGAENRGVIVIGMDPNGRAADLGIEAGDIILELGGKAVQTLDDIRNAFNDARLAGRHGVLMRLKSGHAMRFVAVPVDPV
jgi:serine protease Do